MFVKKLRLISSLNDCFEKVSGYPKIEGLNPKFIFEALREASSEAFFSFSIFVKSVRKRRESVQTWRERQKGEVQIARFDRVQKNFEKSAKSR